eukprot:ANDGO_06657.mRNA.1 hypothetical protein
MTVYKDGKPVQSYLSISYWTSRVWVCLNYVSAFFTSLWDPSSEEVFQSNSRNSATSYGGSSGFKSGGMMGGKSRTIGRIKPSCNTGA